MKAAGEEAALRVQPCFSVWHLVWIGGGFGLVFFLFISNTMTAVHVHLSPPHLPHIMGQQRAATLFLRSRPPSRLISWYEWLHQLRRRSPKDCTTHIIKRLRWICGGVQNAIIVLAWIWCWIILLIATHLADYLLNRCGTVWWTFKLASELWTVRTTAERLMSTVVFPGITRVMTFKRTQ